MEDFEYSVEICDRDWECFFAECEECNLLPPSLAGVDDSGMSDIDDAGSALARRVQQVDPPAGFLGTDWSMDGPPDCEGSPVEHYLSRHGIGGIESVLSGSEEDIHLQSVNVFFEGLKGLTGAQRPSQPSQERVGRNSEAAHREEEEEEEEGGLCSGWQQASGSTLPKNIPELNCPPARGETAVGKETSRPAGSMSHISTKQKVVCELNMSLEPAASTSEVGSNTSDKAKLFIRKDVCAETRLEKRTPHSHSDSSETTSRGEMCTLADDTKQSGLLTNQLPLSKKPGTDLAINLSITPEVKGKKEQTPRISQPDPASAHKSASQESSPASIKRRRRKKRRLSAESCEGAHSCERHVIGKHSDSEEEEFASKGGLPSSDDISSFYLKERQTNITSLSNPRSSSCSSPANLSPQNRRVNDLQCDCQSGRTRCTAEGSDGNIVTNNWSVKPSHQPDEHAVSTGSNFTHVVTNFQPCCAFRSEESHGLTENPQRFVEGFTDKPDLIKENQRKHLKVAFQKMFDDVNQSDTAENLKCSSAEVKSVSPPLRAESHAPTVDVGQNDRLSAAKSGAAEEAGNSGRDEPTLCPNEAESQQQLETDCHNTNLDGTLLGKTRAGLSPSGAIASHQLPTEPIQLGVRRDRFPDELSNEVTCTDSSTSVGPSPDRNSLTSSELKVTGQQTKRPLESHTLSRTDVLNEGRTQAEQARLPTAEIIEHTNNSGSETKPSLSECVLTSLSDLTRVSSVCTLDTDSIMSLSNENITDLSASFCSSSERDSEGHEETRSVAVDQKDVEAESEIKPEPKCDSVSGAVDVTQTLSRPEKGLNSVFAMSSFWSEMEKLTINDILGLRTTSKDASPSFLPTVRESEEAEMLAATDSGFFAQIDDCRTEQSEDAPSGHGSVGSNSIDFSSSKSVTWEREPIQGAEFYPGNIMLTTVTDTPQSVLPLTPHKGLRKMSKNVSVHNLRALCTESSSCTEARENVEYLRDDFAPEQVEDVTSSPSSLMDNYRVSLTDVFQYLFGGKQSDPSQSVADDTSVYLEGDSVPESYDHFFSEFDTESFFYPLISEEDKAGDKPVPIFSCSRSVNRNLQFPEAYEYFFKSSSSDDSSESDEEDNCRPVRVVTRFSRSASSSQLSTDIYDNFFSDSDLKQNLFWKTTFSFRNVNFTASRAQRDAPSSAALVPVSEGSRSVPRAAHRLNVLGNQDVMFPDPLLLHLEERISRQLAQRPFRYEELQTAVSNPGLDGPLLPLKQSDMCLVCIAFASWVLKTANPQVGDAWKAVLLANVSALSAIRYLRKYVRVKAATSEAKLQHAALTDS